ncbi:MAG: hypothetical protein AAB786_02155 [Patescibacteria group bacterium]
MSQKDMLGPLTRALVGVPAKMLGLVLDISNRLGSADAEGFYTDLAHFVREWKKPVQETIEKAVESLLEFVSTTNLSATTEKFVATLRFVVDTSAEAKVKISGLGGNFTSWFLGDDGKVEEPFAGGSIHSYRLKRRSVDEPVIREFGGEGQAETSLTEVYLMMAKQSHGEKGDLLTSGWANIFYCRDKKGVLRTVYVGWHDGGWYVSAGSTGNTVKWYGGGRVFSRNLVIGSLVPQASAAS